MFVFVLTGAKHKRECGELNAPLPLCDPGGDACIAWCINKGYATGKCFGGDTGCTCLRPCPAPAAQPTPATPRKWADFH